MRDAQALYQNRSEEDTSIQTAVDYSLRTYFKSLNGMSPAPNLYEKILHQMEKPLIENVLRYVNGNQVRAASILGINRNTLRKKITVLNIDINGLTTDS